MLVTFGLLSFMTLQFPRTIKLSALFVVHVIVIFGVQKTIFNFRVAVSL